MGLSEEKNSEEKNEVRENLRQWLVAFNAKDLDTVMSFYDPETYYANAMAPLYKSAEEIRNWYAAMMSEVDGTLLFKEEVLVIEGNIALLVGKYFFKPPEGEEVSENAAGRVVLVYRRSADNRWLLLFDMDNMPPDVSPADFD